MFHVSRDGPLIVSVGHLGIFSRDGPVSFFSFRSVLCVMVAFWLVLSPADQVFMVSNFQSAQWEKRIDISFQIDTVPIGYQLKGSRKVKAAGMILTTSPTKCQVIQ